MNPYCVQIHVTNALRYCSVVYLFMQQLLFVFTCYSPIRVMRWLNMLA